MNHALMSLAAAGAFLAACSDTDAGEAQRTGTTHQPAAAWATPTAAPVVALGLTADQLGDADLLNDVGVEIGEVERVVTDASGAVTGLLVEIEDSDPDRYVNIPLDGLSVVQDGDDQDLRSNLTRDQLLAMPEAAR